MHCTCFVLLFFARFILSRVEPYFRVKSCRCFAGVVFESSQLRRGLKETREQPFVTEKPCSQLQIPYYHDDIASFLKHLPTARSTGPNDLKFRLCWSCGRLVRTNRKVKKPQVSHLSTFSPSRLALRELWHQFQSSHPQIMSI